MRIKRKVDRANMLVGLYYKSPTQNGVTNEAFLMKQATEVMKLLDLVLVGDFKLPNICWKYKPAQKRKQSRRSLECVEENFLTQLVRKPIRGNTPLDLLYTNRKGMVADVMVRSRPGRSDYKRTEFSIFGEARRGQENCCLELRKGSLNCLGCWVGEFLGVRSEGQRGPGRLNIPQAGNTKGAGTGCSHVP